MPVLTSWEMVAYSRVPHQNVHDLSKFTFNRMVCNNHKFINIHIYIYIYIKTHGSVVRPKKSARHTMSILTRRKKMQLSHLCSSMIPYPIGTKFARCRPVRGVYIPNLKKIAPAISEIRANIISF